VVNNKNKKTAFAMYLENVSKLGIYISACPYECKKFVLLGDM